MRPLMLAVMAVSAACAPAALKDATVLLASVSTGETANGPTTLVGLSFDPQAGCPWLGSNISARFNGNELPQSAQGGTKTGNHFGQPVSYCTTPAWTRSEAPAPTAQEVVEVTDGRTTLKAVFDTPTGTSELVDPPVGVLPGGVESTVVVVRASLASTTATSPGFDIACEGLHARSSTAQGERRVFTVEAIRTTSGFLPLPSGTHHCAVRFTYDLPATECTQGACTLRREGANVFSTSQPDQRLGFDLVVP